MARDKQQSAQMTDEELDAAAEITPADIEQAQQAWRKNAPPQFRNLLDAEPIPEEDEPVS